MDPVERADDPSGNPGGGAARRHHLAAGPAGVVHRIDLCRRIGGARRQSAGTRADGVCLRVAVYRLDAVARLTGARGAIRARSVGADHGAVSLDWLAGLLARRHPASLVGLAEAAVRARWID